MKRGISKEDYWKWLKQKAKENRSCPTWGEQNIIRYFKEHNVKYHFQKPFLIRGRGFIPDFVLNGRIIIEIDGANHSYQQISDEEREMYFKRRGYTFLRISNKNTSDALINETMNKVMEKIDEIRISHKPHTKHMKNKQTAYYK